MPLRAVTLVCENWGSEPPPEVIDCKTAAELALAVLGPQDAGAVRRLDVGYGEWCEDPPNCPERAPDVGWVLARAATLETLRLRIARDANAGLQIWPPVPGPRIGVPAFRAPPRAAPDLGGGTPAALAGREAFPFCGREDVGQAETYDTAARRCFLDGVMAGSPVELVSRPLLTVPDPSLLSVYRFTGQGAIFHYHRSADGWLVAACGISPIATPAVFVLAGACEQGRL